MSSRRFQPGEGPSRGLLRDCTTSPINRFAALSSRLLAITKSLARSWTWCGWSLRSPGSSCPHSSSPTVTVLSESESEGTFAQTCKQCLTMHPLAPSPCREPPISEYHGRKASQFLMESTCLTANLQLIDSQSGCFQQDDVAKQPTIKCCQTSLACLPSP